MYLLSNIEQEVFDPVTNVWSSWPQPSVRYYYNNCIVPWKDSLYPLEPEIQRRWSRSTTFRRDRGLWWSHLHPLKPTVLDVLSCPTERSSSSDRSGPFPRGCPPFTMPNVTSGDQFCIQRLDETTLLLLSSVKESLPLEDRVVLRQSRSTTWQLMLGLFLTYEPLYRESSIRWFLFQQNYLIIYLEDARAFIKASSCSL